MAHRSRESTNGSIGSKQQGDESPQTLAERDLTLADADQTASDSDQTLADADQTGSDSDQAAADRDQAASDRDLVHGGDVDLHDLTRDLRARSARQRQQTAVERVDAAAARDAVADARDLAAAARDHAAEVRDREMAEREAASDGEARAEFLLGRAGNRRRMATARVSAAEARARAAADREQAAHDRQQAARDRAEGQADREALARQLAIAETDPLTGARARGAGLADVENEIDRARRTTGVLATAYVDVVGLKAINDARGHAAGDALLQRVVSEIRGHLRSYDSIVRLGGDEFLCVMSGAAIEDARRRFEAVDTALAAGPDPCEIKVGFAALEPGDSAAELIRRADATLPSSRGR